MNKLKDFYIVLGTFLFLVQITNSQYCRGQDENGCDTVGLTVEDELEAHDHDSPADVYLTEDDDGGSLTNRKYLLYDVNLSEGFNLRRDVFMRMALLVKQLGTKWTLVVPDWKYVPHWNIDGFTKSTKHEQWSTYFNMASLNKFISVMSMRQFSQIFRQNNSEYKVNQHCLFFQLLILHFFARL